MRSTFRFVLTAVLLFSFLISPVTAQTPDDPTSARDGSIADALQFLPTLDVELTADITEGFEDVTTLPAKGWAQINKSNPIGSTGWFQGNSAEFYAQAGDISHYISANFNNTAGTGTISNWLILPTRLLKNGDTFAFFTRTVTGSVFPDRLEVRMSVAGDSEDVGVDALEVGVFDQLLLSINQDLIVGGYPTEWTQFTIQIQVPKPVIGRLALRYFITNAGPSGANSNYIGIDSLSYVEGPWVTLLPLINK